MRFLRHIPVLIVLLVSLLYTEQRCQGNRDVRLSLTSFTEGKSTSLFPTPEIKFKPQPVVNSTKIKIRIKAGEPTDFSLTNLEFVLPSFFTQVRTTGTYKHIFVNTTGDLFSLRGPPVV